MIPLQEENRSVSWSHTSVSNWLRIIHTNTSPSIVMKSWCLTKVLSVNKTIHIPYVPSYPMYSQSSQQVRECSRIACSSRVSCGWGQNHDWNSKQGSEGILKCHYFQKCLLHRLSSKYTWRSLHSVASKSFLGNSVKDSNMKIAGFQEIHSQFCSWMDVLALRLLSGVQVC